MKYLLLFAAFSLSATALQARLSPLATTPDWSKLAIFQETITKADFVTLLDKVYAPGEAWQDTITVDDKSALIKTGTGSMPFILRFASSDDTAKAIPKYWRRKGELPSIEPGKPLAGLKIALDPGHIGGSWAKMEERWFQIGNSAPVMEGNMTLLVAKILSQRLEDLGAQVFLTRTKTWPVTNLRPNQLKKAASSSLTDKGKPVTTEAIEEESERLFYRVGEIRRRGKLVNEHIRPDLVLCLHFNAEAWGDENTPSLVDENHLHFLITGNLSKEELSYDDQRYDMLVKLLNRSFNEEIAVTDAIARTMSDATGLVPYRYRESNAIRINGNPYLWARNLLANRLYFCPVVYVEPYVMNSKSVFARIQAGDYDGRRDFSGVQRKSIYREYADAVAAGLVAYYSRRQP